MKSSFSMVAVLTALALLLAVGCTSVYKEEVRPTRSYSKNYFFHVVRYEGESLTLISRWYTGADKNAADLRRENRYIAGVDESLPRGSRILIPRRLLQTMKLMPIGFIRKNSPDLDYEEPIQEPTAAPTQRALKTAIPTLTPTQTATPEATSTPTPTIEPPPEPVTTPIMRKVSPPIISRPPAERHDFSDEDPSEAPNTQIQIPQEIVDDLKKIVPKAPVKEQRRKPEVEFESAPLPLPVQEEQNQEFQQPQPVPHYNQPPPEEELEAEAPISDERRELLKRLQGKDGDE